ncbi:fumarylacetoacetate hydrolase family protein [Lentibacillus halophilus]|uniref:Fumarylacetoacetate hydrolase family protein n=1 Tax=Lentibacillus halophilus TaxID=295065 RepID=A0ABP3J3H1_9BACI
MSNVTTKLKGIQQWYDGSVSWKDNTINIKNKTYNVDELPLDVPLNGTVYGALLNDKGMYDKFEPSMNQDPYKAPPKAPVLYIKPANTIIGSKTEIPLPSHVSQLQMGAALAVVMGEQATKVKEQDAFDYIKGYTIVNDVSIPHESVYRPAIKEKARDGFCPVGPWVVDRDCIDNPNDLNIQVYVNGQLKQENNTNNLIRDIGKLIADVTSFMTLYAGDALLVGISDEAPLAEEGDTVTITIPGVGTLENSIQKEELALGGTT